jgi:ABC-type nitrate/sulfonate/bicarbonate transport system substrate-binding protein
MLKKHPAAMKALVTLIRAATDYINADKPRAAEIAAAWTKKPPEVEAKSVPNIVYLTDPGEAYRNGLRRWFGLMVAQKPFTGELKGLDADGVFDRVHDLSLIGAQ